MERVNYTEAQVTEMVTRYHAGETVEQIAEVLGKSVRSVVAKLSREGVYKPKTKAGSRTTKAMVIGQLEAQLACEPDWLVGLEKCDKTTLDRLLYATQDAVTV
jgi:hypothetical protein